MPLPPLHTEVLAALDRGALVLAANQRAARALAAVHAHHMAAQGLTLWQPPALYALDAWAEQQWQRLLISGADDRVLLSAAQEQRLWQQIIVRDKRLQTQRSASSLASLAASAWSRLATYNCLQDKGFSALAPQFLVSEDTRAFARWAQEFDDLCRNQSLLPAAQLHAELARAIAHAALSISYKEIRLVGFDRLTPAQSAIAAALAATDLSADYPTPSISISYATDPDAELAAAARAIAAHHAAHPADRIALILHDLQASRDAVDRALLSALSPHLDSAGPLSPRPFELSLGRNLNQLSMIRTALSLLRWCIEPLPLSEISSLLLSPYLAGSGVEYPQRAQWDAFTLRSSTLLRPVASLSWLTEQRSLPAEIKHRLTALHNLALQRTTRPKALYSEWVEVVSDLLAAVGWPATGKNDRPLDSIEFQTQRRFNEMLDSLAALDLTTRPVTFAEVVETIHATATTTLFSPQSLDAPIQVLGASESAGSTFVALWFLGATDAAWPPSTGPHPFLPFAHQRLHQMPGTAPALALDDATAVLTRITRSAPHSSISYSTRDADGPLHRSPCLDAIAPADADLPLAAEPPHPATLPLSADTDAPPPALTPPVPVHGARVLESQASCPFRAFAEHRLHSQPLDDAEAGLDASERGTLVHAVLAAFWRGVRSQSALIALTPAELSKHKDAAIQAGLQRYKSLDDWDKSFLEVQRAWLHRLLDEWLTVERTRPPFTVLETEWVKNDQPFGDLRINVRIDRIDAVPAIPDDPRNQVIIDYKTGNAARAAWEADRLESAQLPLYALLLRDNLTGLAFAKLKHGDMGISGRSNHPNQIQMTRTKIDGQPYANSEVCNLSLLMGDWQEKLSVLAREYISGRADVDPVNPPNTCRNCAQMPFCRIHSLDESHALDDTEGDDD